MSAETIALDAVATAATLQTVEAANLKTAVDALVAAYASTKSRVDNGLDNVENTTDLEKELSTAVIAALLLKQNRLVSGDNLSTINGVSLLGGTPLVIERSPTSLASLAYESRATLKIEPVSPNLPHVVDDSIIVEGLGLFMWNNTQEQPDDDETCFSTPSSGQWLLMIPSFDLLAAYKLFEDSVVDEFIEDMIAHHNGN
jgi:hypothetical protein